MITIRRMRRRSPLLLLELQRTPKRVLALLILSVVLSNKHCCPLHPNAVQAFISGSPPSSSFLARSRHHNAISFRENDDKQQRTGTNKNKNQQKPTVTVSSKGKDPRGAQWKSNFQKLVQYKELNGHCRVPQRYTIDDVNLGTWVSTQRQNYGKFLAGKYSPMTQERIDRLNSIGFDWGTAQIGWEKSFKKLVQFKGLHGHCQVPSNYSVDEVNLGDWVASQRQEYWKFQDGRHSTMTQERIDALAKIGFDWGKQNIGWDGHFEKLVEYKELHGHCQVPKNHSVDEVNLGDWVNTQRAQYKSFQDGKYSPMTQKRIDALEKIGFVWKLQIGWEANYQLLQEFQKEHGHCQVPRNHSVDNVKLGRWVSNQRVEYENIKDGKSPSMTQERIDQLNSIGFDWSKPQIGWEAQFRLLTEFQKENGHCRVPQNHCIDNVRLGRWVSKQRSEYKKFKDGKASSMTQERINQLNAIGFKWKVFDRTVSLLP